MDSKRLRGEMEASTEFPWNWMYAKDTKLFSDLLSAALDIEPVEPGRMREPILKRPASSRSHLEAAVVAAKAELAPPVKKEPKPAAGDKDDSGLDCPTKLPTQCGGFVYMTRAKDRTYVQFRQCLGDKKSLLIEVTH